MIAGCKWGFFGNVLCRSLIESQTVASFPTQNTVVASEKGLLMAYVCNNRCQLTAAF